MGGRTDLPTKPQPIESDERLFFARRDGERADSSRAEPGIEQRNAATIEIRCIARRQSCTARLGDRGDLRVEFSDGAASSPARGGNSRKCPRGFTVEWQDPGVKILLEYRGNHRHQPRFALAFRQ